ncbi:MAG TPA: multiprotein bridging factor aMBF1 [Candidatus Bathyarchaeia archaeon]|nr:multiprotein bridging factor aMBF1 [Candidatus Bathyarchaeia archaeon]
MYCEVCGSEIVGRPGRSLVEGATLIVCQQCSSLGKELPGFHEKRLKPVGVGPGGSHTRAPIESLPKAIEESDLVEDYSSIIKEARERLGLSQTDLAFKAKEKLTVIQKIELGKILPTMRLTKELEHILRVKLLAPRDEIEVSSVPVKQTGPTELTLGDIALVKHREPQAK